MAANKRFYQMILGDRPAYMGDIGNILQISGILLEGAGQSMILLMPGSSIDSTDHPNHEAIVFHEVHKPSPEEWSEILRMSDDPSVFELDKSGLIKAIHRKLRYQISGAVQQKIWARDEFGCVFCERKMGEVQLTIDHWIPLELGGTNDETNYLSACRKCNKRKGNLHPEEWCRQRSLDYQHYVQYLASCSSISA